MAVESWEEFEAHCQELLGLSPTLASGSQWFDIGDGVDRDTKSVFPIMIDAKSTVRASYTLKAKFLREWLEKTLLRGKRFVMPVRFILPNGKNEDWAVLPLDDLAELLELAKRGAQRGE